MRKTTGGFLTPLRVESVDATNWVLLSGLVWQGSQGDIFEVQTGEYTDFATVPWWTQSLIPRTGTWTKAAVVHDKMCENLNEHYRSHKEWDKTAFDAAEWYKSPTFNSVDTDAVFRKISRDSGTGYIRAELLWLGVRCGALVNPARRAGWVRTLPRFLGDLVAITGLLSVVIWGLTFIL